MKSWWLSVFLFFSVVARVCAQEDIQVMLKQIAKLEIYIIDLEKGYQIAKEGLTLIGDITNGELNLHNIFFSSLTRVNPAIAKYSKIADIISDQVSIVEGFKALIRKINSSGRMIDSEISYTLLVYGQLSDECSQNLNDLIEVTTDGKLTMTDDERIKRIDGIWLAMKDKYAFTKGFINETLGLNVSRDKVFDENELMKMLE